MTTQARRAGGDVTATPVPFSYAQAAKGLSSSGPSAPGSVKQTSGRTTPSTDAVTSPTAAPSSALPPSVPSWADDAEAHDNREDPQTSTVPSKQVNGDHAPTKEAVESLASSETTAKDDDVASLQNASESTSNWENKSQASTSVDKTSEPGEKRPVKGKGKNAEKVPIKPLQEAPVPAVNPWMKRRDELKAKQAAQKPAPKSVTSATAGVIANGAARPSSGAVKKPNGSAATEAELKPKSGEDEKVGSVRKDVKSEVDSERAKKGGRGRPHEKDFKQPATALPLPPDRDQESWPTPENAVDEDKKKAQVKGENPDAERKESSSGRPHGRKEWVPVPHTPSVIFNTPLPNTMSSRRGGRGGGRGGAQGSGRGGSFAANSDKDATVPSTVSNGDGSKRGRPESTSGHGSTPKEEGENSAGIAVQAASNLVPTGEKTLKGTNGSENESAKAAPVTSEATASPQMQGQSNTFPRQHPQNRPAKGRRGDFVPQGEKKKDGENMSPAKDTFPSHDRLSSAVDANGKPLYFREATGAHGYLLAHDTNCYVGHDDAERRHPQDAQNGHRQPGSNERRQFGSYSGRERGRGGGRGGRNYQNNSHQFSNGHTPLQSSSSFPMRSPTTFHPEQPHYFPPGPQGRSYRNGHRSQSVTNENMYRQAPGFSGGAQHVAPINTFVPGMYDYSMTQHPMSAVPFGPFVDPSTLSSMVLTQL